MALLQSSKAIFYHPLDDATESIKSEAWTGTSVFGAAKISLGLEGATGDTLSAFGTEAEFLSAGAVNDGTRVAKLSATTFVVAYGDGSDSNHGTARFGTVSGSDITFGVDAEFESGGAIVLGDILAISATSFVVVWQDIAGSNHGTAKVGTVSGTGITFGVESEFEASATGVSVAAATLLSATLFAVVYSDSINGSRGASKIGTVSGTDITFGAKSFFTTAGTITAKNSAVTLSATSFVVAYQDQTDSGHGTAKVGTVSGTTITFGAETEFQSSANAAVEVTAAPLSATAFVVVYRDNSDGGKGTAKVGTVSGTDITFGAEAEFSTGAVDTIAVTKLSATSFVVAYRDVADTVGKAKVGTVSGTAVTFGAEEEFLAANNSATSLASFSATAFVVAYLDAADSSHGTVKIGSLSASASLSGTSATYDTVAGATKVAWVGWYKKPSA